MKRMGLSQFWITIEAGSHFRRNWILPPFLVAIVTHLLVAVHHWPVYSWLTHREHGRGSVYVR